MMKSQKTSYVSRPVDISSSFLTGPSTAPLVAKDVPFASSNLPEYKNCFAVTIDNVLSPDECAQLLKYAESSVRDEDKTKDGSPWAPALINMGNGYEAMVPGYRESDRIIWDEQTVADRVWARLVQAPGLKERLAEAPTMARTGKSVVERVSNRLRGKLAKTSTTAYTGKWVFSQVNKRLRFLAYTKGNFFDAHCDGIYSYFEDDIKYQTHITLQLYLNDSAKGADNEDGFKGGATAFLSPDGERRLEVNPKAGSVLLFQHKNLLHEGSKVTEGIKYAMRTDILYKWVEHSS